MVLLPASMAHFVRSRLTLKLFVLVAAVVVVPTALLFAAALSLFEGAVRQSLDTELGYTLDRSERDLTQFLADLAAVTGVLATDDGVIHALTSQEEEFRRVRVLDRAVGVALAAVPGRESVRYTLLGSGRIHSSWPRNFRNYQYLSELPLPRAAVEAGGHLVWQGFGPSFVEEEGERELLVSVARLIPPTIGSATGVLILQAEHEAFRKYFKERHASTSFTVLLVAEDRILVDSGRRTAGMDHSPEVLAFARRIASAGSRDLMTRTGSNLAMGRRLTGLPEGLREQGWILLVLYDFGNFNRRFADLKALFIPTFIILLVLALIVSWFSSRRVVEPLKELSLRMENWTPEGSSPAADLPVPTRPDEIGALDRSFRRLELKVLELITSLQREHQVKELFRYRALSAQLNPHFLFNSLNTLRWMAIIRKADNIVEAVDHLSMLLSHSMGKGGDHVTFRDELRSAESYLALQNLRYGGRFTLVSSIPAELLDLEVLRFMLQPLVENCVVHGYSGVSGSGLIELAASREEGLLCIQVADRGKGIGQPDPDNPAAAGGERSPPSEVVTENRGREAAEDNQEDADKNADQSEDGLGLMQSGLGLVNVRDMLAIVYGPLAVLELAPRPGGGAIVNLNIPVAGPGGQS